MQKPYGRRYVLEGAVVADGSANTGPVPAAGLSRRALLTASAAVLPLLVTACKGIQALGAPPPPPADVRTLQASISAEAAMIARYDSALKQLPADAYTSARAVQAEHVAHLALLRSRLVEPPGVMFSVRPPSLRPSSSPSPAAGLTSGRAMLRELELAEQAASDRLIGELGGLPPSLAQLLASIAASEATHVEYLRAARRVR